MHRQFGSRYLVESLYNLGFSSSYSEVQKYEASAAVQKSKEMVNVGEDAFLQFAADNVDHNTNTIDGKNTFNGMGMLSCLTPAPTGHFGRQIRRKDVSTKEIETLGEVNILYYNHSRSNTMNTMRFEELHPEHLSVCTGLKVDLVMKVARPLRPPIPGWSATMQMICKGEFPGPSSFQFLPIIDLNASDISCVYSTLNFIDAEARRYQKVPVVTFDQPLYWKALLVVGGSDLKDVVIRLGGFHTQMSFLGSIGRIMTGSGLRELLELVYAPNTVNHIMTGKAVSRAVRGYMLVDMALGSLLVDQTEKLKDNESLQTALLTVYDQLCAKEMSIEEFQEKEEVDVLETEISAWSGCWFDVYIRRFIYKFLNVCPFDYTAVAGSGKVGPVNQVNHTSWVAVVTPTDRPKSVRNRCLIELFCGVVCVVTALLTFPWV